MGLAEDSQANVDGHIDQGAAIAAGRRGLVALGLSKSSHTPVNRDIDQAIGGGLLLARNVSKDGRAEAQRHAQQAVAGVDGLHKGIIG